MLEKYDDPYDAVREFEQQVADFAGAKAGVATDSCTHAIELCLRFLKPEYVFLPHRTYLSLPMLMHKLNIPYSYEEQEWDQEYKLIGADVYDSARLFKENMYENHHRGMFQCLSFGHGKPLSIGTGGMILTDNNHTAMVLRRMAYDGRMLHHKPWAEQQVFEVGYHYMMRPEQAIQGMELLKKPLNKMPVPNYPDLRTINIHS